MGNETGIVLAVIAGTMVMVLLVMAIVVFVVLYKRRTIEREAKHQMVLKEKELEVLNAAIETQESEREKFSRDLHDEIGPLMSTLKLNMTRYQTVLKKGEPVKEKDLQEQRDLVDHMVKSVRGVAHGLSPRFVREFGLLPALEEYMKELTDLEITFNCNLKSDERFSKNIELNVYRILLELIQNIRKHDKPTELELSIEKIQQGIVFTLAHNGIGLSNAEFEEKLRSAKGIGLESVRARAASIHAVLDYQKGAPSTITLTLTNDEENKSSDSRRP